MALKKEIQETILRTVNETLSKTLSKIKETTSITVDEVFSKLNSLAWIDRQKLMQDEAFKSTEKLLYNFNILKQHLKSEDEYIGMIYKNKSQSIVRYSKNRVEKPDDDQLLQDRIDSYNRSKSDVERVEKALKLIQKKKGYEVIEYRYLKRKEVKGKEEKYTYEEIASLLAGKEGYDDKLHERTVRRYKTELVKEVAISLFGSDAL